MGVADVIYARRGVISPYDPSVKVDLATNGSEISDLVAPQEDIFSGKPFAFRGDIPTQQVDFLGRVKPEDLEDCASDGEVVFYHATTHSHAQSAKRQKKLFSASGLRVPSFCPDSNPEYVYFTTDSNVALHWAAVNVAYALGEYRRAINSQPRSDRDNDIILMMETRGVSVGDYPVVLAFYHPVDFENISPDENWPSSYKKEHSVDLVDPHVIKFRIV